MLTQYRTMTTEKLNEKRESTERRSSLRESLLLKQSFESVSKPLVFKLEKTSNTKENKRQYNPEPAHFGDGPILKIMGKKY